MHPPAHLAPTLARPPCTFPYTATSTCTSTLHPNHREALKRLAVLAAPLPALEWREECVVQVDYSTLVVVGEATSLLLLAREGPRYLPLPR